MPDPRAAGAFPAGLIRPEGAYRGGADAVWLADFARAAVAGRRTGRFVDLGVGCGTAGLAFLQAGGEGDAWIGSGLDIDPDLVAAAESNARLLGHAGRFRSAVVDVTDPEALALWRRGAHDPAAGGFDLVLSNPPWRLEGQGRVPPSPARRRALFGTPGTLPAFARAAALLLAPGGRFACVVGAARIADCAVALAAAGLTPRRLRCIHPRADAPAMLALFEAFRENPPRAGLLAVDAPLIVRPGQAPSS